MSFPRLLLRVSHLRRLSSSPTLRLFSTTAQASTPSPGKSSSTLKPIKSVIRSLHNERNLDAFLSRFNLYSASSLSFRSNTSIYEVAVLRLAAAGRFDDVTAIVEALKPQDHDDHNSSCPSRLISLYGKAGMHERARDTFRRLPRSTRSFNALLSALGSDDGVVDALETIPTDYPEVVPDVYSYTIVINALCDKGDFDKAMEILGLMETKGVVPNVDTFITLLDAFYKNDRYDEAEKVWEIMREKNCQDARTFNSKLKWLVNNGRTAEAVKVFGEMKSGGLKPDGYGMASLIVGHCKDGNLEEAKKLYGRIRRQNCPRDRLMYEALVPKVREAGEINLALGLCHESVKTKCYVSAQVLQVVVDDLVKASKVDDARYLIKATRASRYYSKNSVKMPEPCMKWQMEQQQKREIDKQQKGKNESLEQVSDSWEETTGGVTKRNEVALKEQQMGKDESLKQKSDSMEETEGVETKRGELLIDKSFSEEQNEKEKQAEKAYAKIGIIVKSFEKPNYLGAFGIPLDKNRVKLPSTRTLITVLRSPHIDKKSREQFEMKVRREYIVIKCEPHELHKKYFWFKRTRILGAQFEFVFSYKTRLDMSRLPSSPS